MEPGLTFGQRIAVASACFALAIFGFMLKLPVPFRHIDKELHALFYFLAAAFLNILFARASIMRHAILFVLLYLFGTAIEYAQAYSNRFFRTRIHGRFDAEDVQSNLKGLVAFSVIWLLYTAVVMIRRKTAFKSAEAKQLQQRGSI